MRTIKWIAWFCVGTIKWSRYKLFDHIARKREQELLLTAISGLYGYDINSTYVKLRRRLENTYQKRDKYELPNYIPLRDFK